VSGYRRLRILGAVAGETSQTAAAIEACERAIRVDPSAAPAYAKLAGIHVALQRYEAAIGVYLRALEVWPDEADILVQLSMLSGKAGAWREALDFAERAVALKPRRHLAAGVLADARLMLKDYEGAITAYRDARALPDLSQNATIAFAEIGRDAELIQRLRRVRGGTEVPRVGAGRRSGEGAAAIRSQLDAIAVERASAVFFHVDAGDAHPFAERADPAQVRAGTLDILHAACTSVRVAMPDAVILVLTDAQTDLGLDRGPGALVDHVIRVSARRDQLMYSRMCAYHDLVASGRVGGPVLFLDTDVCIGRDFGALFDGGFDVGLTYRSSPSFAHMPVNEGVMLGASGASPQLAAFFGTCLDLYDWLADQPFVSERYGFDVRNWRGGQLALAAFVDWTVPPFAAADRSIAGIRCRFLPCEAYNRPVKASDDLAALGDRWALHFKGPKAKTLMRAFVARNADAAGSACERLSAARSPAGNPPPRR
jgi:hypothetical protein